MATGRPAFTGATSAVISAAILHQAPAPPRASPAGSARATRRRDSESPREGSGPALSACVRDARRPPAAQARQRVRARQSIVRSRPRRGIARRWAAIVARCRGRAVTIGAAAYFLRASHARADRQGHDRPRRLQEHDRRRGVRRDAATGPVGAARTVAVPQSRLGRAHSEDTRLMGRPADARLTPDVAREICVRTGGAAVLEGSIASLGTQYVLGLRAEQLPHRRCPRRAAGCRRHGKRTSSTRSARSPRNVQDARRRIARHGRKALDAARGGHDAVARGAEGLQHSVEGQPHDRGGGRDAAVQARGRRSIRNSRSPMRTWGWPTAIWASRRCRPKAPRRATRCGIAPAIANGSSSTTIYDRQVTGNLERELQTLTLWAQTYPARIHRRTD